MNTNRQQIRLTEQDLHFLVENAVHAYLVNEGLEKGFWNNLKGAMKPMGQVASQAMSNAGQAASNKLNSWGQKAGQAMNRMGQAATNAVNKVGDAASAGMNTMKAGWQDAKLQGLKQDTVKALNSYLQYAQNTVGAGEKTVQAVQNCIQALNNNASVGKARTGAFRNQFQRSMGMRTA